ncbi:collagen-flanked surface repeat-containing protein [Granulicatella sp.]
MLQKETVRNRKQIYSIRKNKAYGASSVLIGLMGSVFLLGGLAPAVQAEENEIKPEVKPTDASNSIGTNASTVETPHLIVTSSQPTEGAIKPESTSTVAPKVNKENPSTNAVNPTNNTASQPKEETTTSTATKTEAKPEEAATTPKRAVSIVYKVRYVDRKSHKVVHEVTKTKTVETTEAKAKVTVTEIGGELANDSQLENYYVPDGNPTTFTKEIVEGEDNVFVYEVEGSTETETAKRDVTLKYTIDYIDEKSGLVLASEEKEEKVSTTEKIAKKEVTVQPSLDANEKLKDWVLSEDAPASQKLTLTEGTVGKVTFKLQKSEPGKVRNKRGISSPIQTGQPYLTLENHTPGYLGQESMTFAGNGKESYTITYQIGASNLPNNDLSDLELTQGAKDLGFNLDRVNGLMTATITPTREMAITETGETKRSYEVGFYTKSNPTIKVAGTITITASTHYGFMIFGNGYDRTTFKYFANKEDNDYDRARGEHVYIDYTKRTSPIFGDFNTNQYVHNKLPKEQVTLNNIYMPITTYGYMMSEWKKSIKDTTPNTERYYSLLPIFAPLDKSSDFANDDKQGLSITDFKVLEASEGVSVKLLDLRKDRIPEKSYLEKKGSSYSTVMPYNSNGYAQLEGNFRSEYTYDLPFSPYYLQFTKLPKTVGNYFVKIEITDSMRLTKQITLNFSTYENSVSSSRYDTDRPTSYALTVADTLFESNEEYLNKETGKAAVPMSNKEQILGKVTLNKDNAYIKSDEFPAGVELRAVEGKVDGNGNPTEAYVVKKEGVKVQPGVYSFSVKAHDGHYQDGGSRRFDFEIVDAINPIADQHWREGSVPPPISVSMENHSHITGIRVESSGNYAYFEGNATNSSISVYGLKRTEATQKARVYVTYTDGAGKSHETFTDFNYEIEPNTVDGLNISVTNDRQEIFEGENFQDMVIETTPSEGVTIKVDKDKLPKGTRLVGNVLKGKGLYEGVYDIPVLAVKGDVIKSAAVHLVVKPKEFVVPNETSEVEVLSNNIMSVTTNENGEIVKTPVTRFGLQNVPDDAIVTYSPYVPSGLSVSNDGKRITGTPTSVSTYNLTATISRKGSNGQIRKTTSTYTIKVTGLTPSLTISSANQPVDAYGSEENRLIAPIGTPIPSITIQHDPYSELKVASQWSQWTQLPEGLSYTYDETTHTGTITGTPRMMNKYEIPVEVSMPSQYRDDNSSTSIKTIYKTIYIEVTPMTSALSIDNAEQTFSAAEEMAPITVSNFDERATIELEGAPTGVSYDLTNHQITGAPLNGVGTYTFNVKAVMPSTLGGQVTRKPVILHVTKIEPTLSATPTSATVTASESIPEITITKDSVSTLSEPSVMIEGTSTYTSLSSLGLSYDAASKKITGTPTIVGNHTIHLATTLSERYTGISGGKTLTLDIPLTVRAKEFDFVTNQEQTTTVLSAITPINLTVPEGIEVSVSELPSGLTYDAERKMIQGIPNKVGTYTITVTGRPRGFSGNDKTAILTIHVNHLPATIGITNKEQTVQVGTAINDVTVTSSEHANIYGIDALLSAVSGNNSGIVEANIANYFLGAYGLTYNATNHTITGTPTKTGRIVFTFIARTSENLGAAEARETVVLNVVESLSKIPVITEVREGTSVVKGTGVAGATVTVTLPNGDEKTALVSGDGSWSVDTTAPLGKGQSISARQKEVNKTMSNDISATVVANAGLELSKEPIVDAIIEGVTTITGKGENGSTINVTLPNGTVKTTTVTDGRWAVTLESPVAKGDNILVSQTQPNKATSPSVSATAVPTITKGDKGEDGAAGRDGISPEVSIVEDSEGNHVITITQPGKTPITTKVKNGRDGRTPKVAITPIYEDSTQPRTRRARSVDSQPTRKQIGIHITVYYDNNNSGSYDNGDEVISEEDIYDGLDGNNGQDGKDILSGTTDPTSETGKEGDKYVNTTTGDIFVKKNGQWEREGNLKGPKGDKGEDGAAGAAGQNGQNGQDGKDILSGTSDPTSETGKEGDKYVNTTTGDIFVKKNGQWEREGNLKGPKGDKGDTPTITTQPGADGISTDIILTIPGKEPITVNVKNGTNGRDGLNGKSLVVKKEGNETKIYVEDPANPGQPLDATKPLATILDGLKGDKGEAGTNGVDGKSPVITMTDNGDGTHSIIIRNPDGSESTTKVKDGKDGKTATITTTENPDGSHTITVINPDGASKEIVVRDGKTPKLEVIDNGNGSHTVRVTDGDGNVTNTIIKDGKDGKSATATTTENPDGSHTVTITNPDGTTNNFIVKNGRDGVDGRTPTATVRNNNDGSHTIVITNPDGVTTETTIRDGQSPKITITDEQNGTHKITVLNGDGTTTETIIKDGKSPVATVTDNHDGTYTIRVENGNGTVSEMTVRDGKSPTAKVVNNGDGTHTVTIVNSDGTTTTTIVRDGQSPKLEVIDNHNGSHTIKVIGSDGKETSTTIFDGKSPTAKIVNNGDGTHTVIIVDSNGQQYTSIIKDGKDGKDGKSPTVTVRNNNDGTHTITIINPDGSKTETIIKDGKDGKSPEVTVEDNGNGTYTITIINVNGIVYKTIIRDGKCGCNDKPGGHTPENPTTPKPENPTTPGEPTFAMPAPPVHDKPEFKGGVPGMPAVHEKTEYPGIPTNPNSDETTPGTPTPGTSMNPNPGVPTSEGTTNPNPGVPTPEGTTNPNSGVPTSEGSTNLDPGVPTSVGSTNPNSDTPTSEGLTQTNPEKSSAVNEHIGSELPKTGTKVEYLPMLLASGALLTIYIGRRKEEEE